MSTLSTLEANSLKGALEALLLVSSDPVSAPALAGALDIAPGECASLLAELKVEYEEANRGFQLREVAGGWRLFVPVKVRREQQVLVLARGVQHTLRLLLAGVIVGVVLGALRDLVELASPDILQAMQAFTLGSTAFVGWAACLLMAVACGLCASNGEARRLIQQGGVAVNDQKVASIDVTFDQAQIVEHCPHVKQLRVIGQPVHLQEQLAVHLLHGAVYQVVVGTFALFEQVHDGLVDKSQLARAEHVGLQKSNHVGNSLGVGKQAGNYRFFVGDPRVFLNHCS